MQCSPLVAVRAGFPRRRNQLRKQSRPLAAELLKNYPAPLVRVLTYFCDQWLELTQQIKKLDGEIQQETMASERLNRLEMLYRSAPGIGRVSSNELCRELGDLKQFSHIKKAYSFVGLTPSEFSSGESIRRGHISQAGRPRLRHVLIEIAWRSIKRDPGLHEKFKELAVRRGKKRAIVAIARVLVGRLRACCLAQESYRTERSKTVV